MKMVLKQSMLMFFVLVSLALSIVAISRSSGTSASLATKPANGLVHNRAVGSGAKENPEIMQRIYTLEQNLNGVSANLAGLNEKLEQLEGAGLAASAIEPAGKSTNQHTDQAEVSAPFLLDSNTEMDEQQTVNAERTRAEDRYRVLRDKVMQQEPDPGWSESANEEITNAVHTQELSGSQLVGTDCRSSLCEVSVLHTDEKSMNQFVGTFFRTLNWQNSNSTIQVSEQGDRLVTNIIISRSNHALPR